MSGTRLVNPLAPAQIGDVVGVDRMDTVDRQKLDPRVKLQLLCAEAKATFGADPRGGGFAIVGRPRVVLQLMLDIQQICDVRREIKLERAVILGDDAHVVGSWDRVPIWIRCRTNDDNLHVCKLDIIPAALPVDKVKASVIRTYAHRGKLEDIRVEERLGL